MNLDKGIYDKKSRHLYKILIEDYKIIKSSTNKYDIEDNLLLMKSIEIVLRYYLVHNDYIKTIEMLSS